MFSYRTATTALRILAGRRPAMTATRRTSRACSAGLHTTGPLRQASNKDKSEPAHAGSFARTDDSITVEYPEDHELQSSQVVTGAGRAGMHVYPTLATFSLEGKVGVVTGGARGLGLVMGQGMVVSGADLAIVDLNSEFWSCLREEEYGGAAWVVSMCSADCCGLVEEEGADQARAIMEQFKKDHPQAKK